MESQHRMCEAEFGTGSCHVRHEQQRTGRRIVVGEMVLQEPDPMVAEFLRQKAVIYRLPVRPMVGQIRTNRRHLKHKTHRIYLRHLCPSHAMSRTNMTE